MSLHLAKLRSESNRKDMTREQILALMPEKTYDDGRTKQSFKDQTDINKIMQRFTETGTISHLAKFEGVYADFSDFDFHLQSTMLAKGETIFEALPAEIRREFGQSAEKFFEFVNDPENKDHLREKLPALAAPGQQLPKTSPPDADTTKASADADKPAVIAEPAATAAEPSAGSG